MAAATPAIMPITGSREIFSAPKETAKAAITGVSAVNATNNAPRMMTKFCTGFRQHPEHLAHCRDNGNQGRKHHIGQFHDLFSQGNQRLLQLPRISFHLLHRRLGLAEQVLSRSRHTVISLSHGGQRSNKFQVPSSAMVPKAWAAMFRASCWLGAAADIRHNGIDHLLLGGFPILPCQEQGLGSSGNTDQWNPRWSYPPDGWSPH